MKKKILLFTIAVLGYNFLQAQYSPEDQLKHQKNILKGKWNLYYVHNDFCHTSDIDGKSLKKPIASNVNFNVYETKEGGIKAEAKVNYVINETVISEIVVSFPVMYEIESLRHHYFSGVHMKVKVNKSYYSGIECLSTVSDSYSCRVPKISSNEISWSTGWNPGHGKCAGCFIMEKVIN